MLPVYATVEQVNSSLENTSTYSNALILRRLDAASRNIEAMCHRRFYPERRTARFDWPNYSYAATWRLDLDDNQLISLEALTNGDGTDITSNAILRRGDDKAEAPYDSIEMDLSGPSAFSGGSTFQRSITVLGLYGDTDTSTAQAGGALTAGINSSVTSVTVGPSAGTYTVGTGSLLLCGTERMLVTKRRMSDSGVNTAGALLDLQSATSLAVTDGTAFSEGEIILIDAEKMIINEITGNTLIVTRAVGSALAQHSSSIDIYAFRTCIVQRGALGSTAASHSNADPVYVHEFPVNEWCVAETVVMLEQGASGYARTIGTGSRVMETIGQGLEDARARGMQAFGRVSRLSAI